MAVDNPDWSKAGSTGGLTYSGSIPGLGSSANLAVSGASGFLFRIALAGAGPARVQGSLDGVNFQLLNLLRLAPAEFQEFDQISDGSFYYCPCAGVQFLQINCLGAGGPATFVASAIFGAWLLESRGQQPMLTSLPVAIASDQSALSVTPAPGGTRLTAAPSSPSFDVTLGANASLLLIGGVAGERIYLDHLNLEVVTTVDVQLQLIDGASDVFDKFGTTITGYQSRYLGNVAAAVGQGISIKNTAGVAAGHIRGSLIATQQ